MALMTILPHPSVSPLHSFASLPTHREPSFPAALRSIIGWATGRQPTPSKGEAFLEQKIIERLAAELEAEAETSLDEASDETSSEHGGETSLTPLAPKRDRRVR